MKRHIWVDEEVHQKLMALKIILKKRTFNEVIIELIRLAGEHIMSSSSAQTVSVQSNNNNKLEEMEKRLDTVELVLRVLGNEISKLKKEVST